MYGSYCRRAARFPRTGICTWCSAGRAWRERDTRCIPPHQRGDLSVSVLAAEEKNEKKRVRGVVIWDFGAGNLPLVITRIWGIFTVTPLMRRSEAEAAPMAKQSTHPERGGCGGRRRDAAHASAASEDAAVSEQEEAEAQAEVQMVEAAHKESQLDRRGASRWHDRR